MKAIFSIVGPAGVFLFAGLSATASSITWVNDAGGGWVPNQPCNTVWTGCSAQVYPSAVMAHYLSGADLLFLNGNGSITQTNTGFSPGTVLSINSIAIGSAYLDNVSTNNTLTIASASSNAGTLSISGVVNLYGNLNNTGGLIQGNGVVNNFATITGGRIIVASVNNQGTVSGATVLPGATITGGTVAGNILSGGILNGVTNTGSVTEGFVTGAVNNTAGSFTKVNFSNVTLTGGSVNGNTRVSGNSAFDGIVTQTGTLTITGGTLDIAGTLNASVVDLTAGTLDAPGLFTAATLNNGDGSNDAGSEGGLFYAGGSVANGGTGLADDTFGSYNQDACGALALTFANNSQNGHNELIAGAAAINGTLDLFNATGAELNTASLTTSVAYELLDDTGGNVAGAFSTVNAIGIAGAASGSPGAAEGLVAGLQWQS